MEIKSLAGIDSKAILQVFNASFSDYFVPFKLTEAQLISKIAADKTDLDLSVGVFESGKLIAFILHGFDTLKDQKIVYNGGTGVIPEKRGLGLTKQMYRFILPTIVAKGVDKLQLEVINENVPAITSYERAGFKAHRELLCYKGEVGIATSKNSNLNIKELQGYDWDLMESFWDYQPSWQNSNRVLDDIKQDLVALGAYYDHRLLGYVVYQPTTKRIQQLAVRKDFRRKGVASALCSALSSSYGNTLSIINVDKRATSMNAFLKTIGLEVYLVQLEMELQLTK